MTAYYNEINPDAAAHLRSLIAAGQMAPGIVDERSIEDVRPDELAGYAQCHFFAGIGIWSLALRQAGIPDDYPIWSMSCPCQPFSAAGKGEGFADERHLWPAAYHLVSQCRPERIVGEQVASKDTNPWIDLVQVDLEALGYAFGCVPFPSAGVGAPHIRDRAYWCAGVTLGDTGSTGLERFSSRHSAASGWEGAVRPVATAGQSGWLDNTISIGRGAWRDGNHAGDDGQQPSAIGGNDRPSTVNGHWSASDWLHCRDGKWRPVEPGTFPLAHGMPRSMGALSPELRGLAELAGLSGDSLKRAKNYRTSSLKGYGNAFLPHQISLQGNGYVREQLSIT
jgi:DNA (cytosine-5)-methyltransferase 1